MNETAAAGQPATPFQVEMTAQGLRATIPPRRLTIVVVFILAWLCGWGYGEYSAIRGLVQAESIGRIFLAVWLAGWTFGGFMAGRFAIALMGRRETITINATTMEHELDILGVHRVRSFRTSAMQHMRIAEYSGVARRRRPGIAMPFFNTTYGFAAFDYDGATVRLAPALSETDAAELVKQLAPYLPQRLPA